jgi:hypothetical protein
MPQGMPQGAQDKARDKDITAPPPGPGPGDPPHVEPSEDGDFDDRAAEFWSVYVKEAQRHDEALIGTWKEDMEAVIIFVRSPASSPTL